MGSFVFLQVVFALELSAAHVADQASGVGQLVVLLGGLRAEPLVAELALVGFLTCTKRKI